MRPVVGLLPLNNRAGLGSFVSIRGSLWSHDGEIEIRLGAALREMGPILADDRVCRLYTYEGTMETDRMGSVYILVTN